MNGKRNINGVIEDGSQRSFFPTGYHFYTYARTLYDTSLSIDEIKEDYFSHAFGEDWKKFYDYLSKLTEAFGHDYLSGDLYRKTGKSKQYAPTESVLFAPERVEKLRSVHEITKEGRALIAEHYNSDYRVRTVSVRLLEFHALYADLFADALIEKAQGNDDKADELYENFKAEVGKHELAFERWYDQCLFFYALNRMFKARTQLSDQEEITSV